MTDAHPRHPFHPHPLLTHPDLMTLIPRYWPRRHLLRDVPSESRFFTVQPGSRILGFCHWHAERLRHPTLILIHGLEGCSESHYMRAIATKAWRAGFNVIRLNQRNCGGTEHETPTLYHNGLSGDLLAVATELTERDRLPALWLAGYSMGGNLVLRMAGEVGGGFPPLKGVATVCPNIDPAACIEALEQRRNWFYHRFFLRSLQARLRRKAQLFPGRFDLTGLQAVCSMREFDDRYTARDGGFRDVDDYYDRSGARHVLANIAVPTLILTSEDDPFIPPQMFRIPAITGNRAIRLIMPRHGGHCGFFQRPRPDEDCYWGENRLIDFISAGAETWKEFGRPLVTDTERDHPHADGHAGRRPAVSFAGRASGSLRRPARF